MSVSGYIYLIHFDEPYRHARHYTGWTRDLPARLRAHANGTGARLMEVITDNGITWQLAKVYEGDRTEERRRKNQKKPRDWCPVCRNRPGEFAASLVLDELADLITVTKGLGRVAA